MRNEKEMVIFLHVRGLIRNDRQGPPSRSSWLGTSLLVIIQLLRQLKDLTFWNKSIHWISCNMHQDSRIILHNTFLVSQKIFSYIYKDTKCCKSRNFLQGVPWLPFFMICLWEILSFIDYWLLMSLFLP